MKDFSTGDNLYGFPQEKTPTTARDAFFAGGQQQEGRHMDIEYAASVLACGCFEGAAKQYEERLAGVAGITNNDVAAQELKSMFSGLVCIRSGLSEDQLEETPWIEETLSAIEGHAQKRHVVLSVRATI